MTRWAPGARDRLERSALELFETQGYAATTIPQITDRAGLTRRTFFRYFADKAEVLFADSTLASYTAELVRDHFDPAKPVVSLRHLLTTVADDRFEGREDHLLRVRAIVTSDPQLQERGIAKQNALTEVLRAGVERAGLPAVQAHLLATYEVTVLYTAVELWLAADPPRPPLREVIDAVTEDSLALFRS